MSETDKELLKDSKILVENLISYISLGVYDKEKLRWLVKQAEKSLQLEEEIKSHAPDGRNYTNQQYVELKLDAHHYEEALKAILKHTSCDDTWDFVNRVLQGDEPSGLPYRMN